MGAIFAVVAASVAAQAQTPLIVGYPANFDTYNNTGAPTYGFEIEADGIQPSDVTRVFPSNFPCASRPALCDPILLRHRDSIHRRRLHPMDEPLGLRRRQQFTINTPIANGTGGNGRELLDRRPWDRAITFAGM